MQGDGLATNIAKTYLVRSSVEKTVGYFEAVAYDCACQASLSDVVPDSVANDFIGLFPVYDHVEPGRL